MSFHAELEKTHNCNDILGVLTLRKLGLVALAPDRPPGTRCSELKQVVDQYSLIANLGVTALANFPQIFMLSGV
jgi:hypothetical protein